MTERDQATWQNALALARRPAARARLRAPRTSAPAATPSPSAEARHNNALVLGYSGRFGAHRLQADVRHDDNSVYGGNTTGRLGLTLRARAPGCKLRALAGTTFRAPTFNDLFYPGLRRRRPIDQPERGRSVEVGASWQGGRHARSRRRSYRNDVRDLIVFEPNRRELLPGPIRRLRLRLRRATSAARRLQGATLRRDRSAGASATLRGNVDFLDATDSDTGVPPAAPRRAPGKPGADWTRRRLERRRGLRLRRLASRGSPARPSCSAATASLDLRAAWRFTPQWHLEAKLLNALDHRVEPLRDYQGLGRQAWIGVRFDGQGL